MAEIQDIEDMNLSTLEELIEIRAEKVREKNKLTSPLSRKVPKEALWKPAFYTKPNLENPTIGPAVALFAEHFITAFRGKKQNQAVEFMQWQRWLTNCIFELDENGNFRYSDVTVLVPRKNGKTFLIAIFLMYHLFTAPIGAEIYSVAKNQKQSKLIYKAMENWINMSQDLKKVLRVIPSSSKIVNRVTGAEYAALAADSGSIQGLAPYAVAGDEVHTWDGNTKAGYDKANAMYFGLLNAVADVESSQFFNISTAGNSKDSSLLGGIYKAGIKEVKSKSKTGKSGFFCWEASEEDNPLEEATWIKANPSYAEGMMVPSKVQQELKAAAELGLWNFMRDRLNIWTNVVGVPFIEPILWKNNAVDISESVFNERRRVVAGFDASFSGDSTGIVICDMETGQMKVWEVWEAPTPAVPGWFIDRDEVKKSFKRLYATHEVLEVWADSFYYQGDIVKWNRDYGWKIESISQSKERKDRYSAEFRQSLAEREISHFDEEVLNKHVANTALTRNGTSFAKTKENMKIDLFVCAIMANGARKFLSNKAPRKRAKILVRNQ